MPPRDNPEISRHGADARVQRIGMIAVALFAAWYVGRPVMNPFHYVFLRDVILATHEAGHVIFMPFGEYVMVLGGTLFQVLLPIVFIGYFWRRNDRYAAFIISLWLAFALTDAAVYIGDARTRQLPLLGGDPAGHDWTFLLVQTGLLEHDRTIARAVRGLGLLVFGCAVAGALHAAWRHGAPAAAPDSDGTLSASGADAASPAVTASRWTEG